MAFIVLYITVNGKILVKKKQSANNSCLTLLKFMNQDISNVG